MKILVIDNFDSFTYNLVDYLGQCGADCDVIRNNFEIDEINIFKYNGLVLSPGPGAPQNAGSLMQYINAFHHLLPILGICLGHQALGLYFGAELVKAVKPMHGKISENIIIEEDRIFKNVPTSSEVVRYHSLILKNLPVNLKVTSNTNLDEIMAFSHSVFSIKGLQFHPEAALTTYGFKMISNWVEICSSQN